MSVTTLDALPAGYTIAGYEITRTLGAGGFGITYEAVNPVTRRRVAIKEFYPVGLARRGSCSHVAYSQADDGVIGWALEKLRSTTRLLCDLDHPNILRVLAYMPANSTGYMVME